MTVNDGGKGRSLVGGGPGEGIVFVKGGYTTKESQSRVLRDVVLLADEGFEGQRAFGWTCSRLIVVGSDDDGISGCAFARDRSVEACLVSIHSMLWSRVGR